MAKTKADAENEKMLKELLFDETYADMFFLVEGERIPAHKNIDLKRCPYFS